MNTYAPLEILKQNPLKFEDIHKNLIELHIPDADKIKIQDFIDSFTFIKYGRDDIRSICVDLFINGIAKEKPNYIKNLPKGTSIFTEVKDLFLWPAIYELWGKSKQVFKPDGDFAEALLHTEKACITANMVDHLPYNLFYLDLSACDFYPIDGVFVYIKRYDKDISINMQALSNTATFSFYLNLVLDDNYYREIDLNSLTKSDFNYVEDFICEDIKQKVDKSKFKITRNELSNFVLQMILYLSIENPQLSESDLTKHTYRLPSETHKVKHKWSEVRIQDVGIKYGNAFRKTYSSYKKDYERTPVDHKRKSPIPHFRCAHWHKFWVGKGRTELKLLWMEPVFVGNGDSHNIIIHSVK